MSGAADREPEAATRPRDELVGVPRRAVGLGAEHDLLGRERRQGSGDRLQWIGVADPSFHRSTQAETRAAALIRAPSSSDSHRCSREFSAGATTSTSAFATWTGVKRSRAMMSTFMMWVPSRLVARAVRDTGNHGPIPAACRIRGRGNISAAKESLEV